MSAAVCSGYAFWATDLAAAGPPPALPMLGLHSLLLVCLPAADCAFILQARSFLRQQPFMTHSTIGPGTAGTPHAALTCSFMEFHTPEVHCKVPLYCS